MTLAIIAFLMGGFCINANAQNRKAQNPVKKEATSAKKATATPKEGTDKMVKEYEVAVDQCVAAYKEMQKGSSTNKTGNFDKLLAKAEDLKAKLDKSKADLTKSQIERVQNATKKLQVVYTKG